VKNHDFTTKTENGTDISEIVTENEATPDIQNIDPLICGENQATDESRVLQEILINTLANTDTPLDLPFLDPTRTKSRNNISRIYGLVESRCEKLRPGLFVYCID
jgi:hypothetical protein